MTLWTSGYLVEKLDELEDEEMLKELAEDGYGISAEEEKLGKLILALIDQSLDSPLPEKLRGAVGQLRGNRNALEGWIDECLCRDFLRCVPQMVQRARRIAPLFVGESPQPVVRSMWRESVRSYVYGQFQASVALSRATIEHALKAAMEARLVPLPDETTFATLIKSARDYRILSSEVLAKADSVRRVANRVLHDTTADAGAAGTLEMLEKTRDVLEALHAA